MELKFISNLPLAPFTTFKIGGSAQFYVEITDSAQLPEALEYATHNRLKIFVLGGGSNVLISDNGISGLVIHLLNRGINVISEDDKNVRLQIASGENWDEVVAFCVTNNWWGVENLSHIPGLCGSLAVQNVGAYGQEASQVIESVEVFDFEEKKHRTLSNADCGFSYRKSLFNTVQKGRYIILATTIVLSKSPAPNIQYVDVQKYFVEKSIHNPTILQIREAIISIRDKKYPFPKTAVGGSAGSFFKNRIINEEQYEELKRTISTNFLPTELERLEKYRQKALDPNKIKIPGAFLIEIGGLKGLQIGGAKINEPQPLVILNTGNATASDVMNLFKTVRQKVYVQTGIILENEPELIGFSQNELDNYFSLR